MTRTILKASVATGLVAALAFAGASLAAGGGKQHAKLTAATTTTTTTPGRTPETPLTGDTLTSANAAAVAKVGGTADSATTENDSSDANAKYEVHVTKADGTHVKVIEDASFAVLTVETGGPGGHGMGHGGWGGHDGPGGGNGETALTGDTLTQANAAAVAKVGGTADFATTESDSSDTSAKYEVHVTKADGTHVKVIEDASFAVLSVETGPAGGPGMGHGMGGPGGHGMGGFGHRH